MIPVASTSFEGVKKRGEFVYQQETSSDFEILHKLVQGRVALLLPSKLLKFLLQNHLTVLLQNLLTSKTRVKMQDQWKVEFRITGMIREQSISHTLQVGDEVLVLLQISNQKGSSLVN